MKLYSILRPYIKVIYTLLLLVMSLSSYGQAKSKGLVKGELVDSVMAEKIKDATITVLATTDSSMVAYGLSDQNGSFSIARITPGDYLLQVTMTGYDTRVAHFSITPEQPVYDAGTLYLYPHSITLADVIIKAAPILIKGDTTEFYADNFKTIPNATAEDLLKKLPGMEVEKDGTVKSQGEKVTRILVDGKRFFGKDPKMATRNIPTDMIDKIQVIDAQTEESEFNGFDDGERIMTINIITKKNKKKGYFGKGSIGAGDEGRYAAALSANRFDGDQQMSFILQANNINSQSFTVQDFLGTMSNNGKGTQGGNIYDGNRNGISDTKAGGINYNGTLGKKTELNGSYFFNRLQTQNNRDRYRETFVNNDSSLFNFNHLAQDNNNINHRFNFQLQYDVDSMNTLLFRPELNYQKTTTASESNSVTTKEIAKQLNEVHALGSVLNTGIDVNNSLLYRHRFGKKGRSFAVNFTQSTTTNDKSNTNLSVSNRPNRGLDTIDQVSTNIRDGKSWGSYMTYTEPIGRSAQFEISYRFNQTKNTSDQQTFRKEGTTGLYDIKVNNLTNYFENKNLSNRLGASFKKQMGRWWNYSAGLGIQRSALTSNNLTKEKYLQQSFTNFSPTFNLQYKKNRYKNFRFIYKGSTQQPTITQLQDVINNNNILNIRTGNPRLVQEFNNKFSLRYNSFNSAVFTNFSFSLTGGTTAHKIGNSTTINTTADTIIIDEYTILPGAQFTRPVNLEGAYNAAGNVFFSFPVKKWGGNIHLSGRLRYDRDIALINDQKNYIDDYSLSGSVKLSMNLKERFDLNLSGQSIFNIVRYSRQPERNGDYFIQRFSAEPTYSSRSGWIVSGDFDYLVNRGQFEGFNESIPILNMGLAKMFLKKQQAELRFTVFDVFNQNKNISRNVEQNYVEDIRADVLNRYFLLSLTYHLKNFKGAGKSGKVKTKKETGVQKFRQSRIED